MSLIKKEVKMTFSKNFKKQSYIEKELEKQKEKKSKVMSIGGISDSSLIREIPKKDIGRKIAMCSCDSDDDNPW
jgi:hypothetical protein